MRAPTLRITREVFLADPELRKALGVAPSTVILKVERKMGTYTGRGRGDQTIDLEGCVVTLFDPEEVKS